MAHLHSGWCSEAVCSLPGLSPSSKALENWEKSFSVGHHQGKRCFPSPASTLASPGS